MKKKLKVSILLNSKEKNTIPEKKIIKLLKEKNFISLKEIFYIDNINKKKKKINFISRYFFLIIFKIESFFYKIERINLIKKNNKKLFSEVKKFKVEINKKKNKYFFNQKIDVLVNLQQSLINGDILKHPRYGIWSLHLADINFQRNGHVGFWEILEKKNKIGITLQRLKDNVDAGDIIEIKNYKTKAPSLKSQIFLQEKSCDLIIKNLKKITFDKIKFKSFNNKSLKTYRSYPTIFKTIRYTYISMINIIFKKNF